MEWDLIPTDPPLEGYDRAIKYPGLGVRSVGPVGDFLESMNTQTLQDKLYG